MHDKFIALGHGGPEEYAEFHKVSPENAETHLSIIPRCGIGDRALNAASGECKQASNAVKISLGDPIPSFSPSAWQDIHKQALGEWAKVANLSFTFVADPNSSNIYVIPYAIDGPGNVLADCQMPCNYPYALRMRVDTGDGYDAPMLLKTLIHEYGHGLGLDHSSNVQDIMYPVLQPGPFGGFGPGDIQEIQARYGPPQNPTPEPNPQPPSPPANASDVLFNTINLVRSKLGKAPLQRDARLDACALSQAAYCDQRGTLTHRGYGFSNPQFRAKLCGWFGPVGECGAFNTNSPQDVVMSWVNDLPHSRILLGDYTHVGCGVVNSYAFADFGKA